MKKRFRKFKKKLPSALVLIPVTVLAVVLVGGYFLFFSGDDNSDKSANAQPGPQPTNTNGETGKLPKPKPPRIDPGPPAGKVLTIDSARKEAQAYAIATANGSILAPAKIMLRIGAAPKQPVAVNASITCLVPNESAKSRQDTFQVTPPVTRKLTLPVPDPVSCVVSVGAQLTLAGKGRIKVFLTGTRRPGG